MKVPPLTENSDIIFNKNILFKDIFDLDEIQKLQDIFSDANQVASIISHPDGTPITKQSNFCKLCLLVIKKTENGREKCMKADSAFCAKGANGLTIGSCINSGLTNAVAGILVGGQHVASWVIGQVRTEQTDPQQIYQYADEIGIEREEFMRAWAEIPLISASRFEKISSMLFGFVKILSEKGYQNLMLKNQIADRQKKALELEKSEASYLGLFNSVSEAIYVMSNEGSFLNVNEGAVKMYGHPREYLIGKTPADVGAPGRNDLEEVGKMLVAATLGEPQEFEFWGIRSNGEEFPKEVRLTKGIYFGQEVVIALARDITARKKAEEELSRSEKRYRNIFSFAQIGIYIADIDGNFLTANDRLVKILGYDSVAELMTKNIAYDVYGDQNERVSLISKYKNVENTGNLELSWKKKDGSQIWVDLNAHPVKDESGTVIYFEGFVEDITQSKKSEQALRTSESNLNALINNREESIWSIDNEYNLIICNDYFKKAYLMAYNIELHIGINMINSLPSDLVPFWKPKYEAALNGKSISFQFDETVLGKELNFQIYLNPIFSENKVIGVSALSLDVTDTISTTKALMESERKMTTLVGNLPGMAYRQANDKYWTTSFISDSCFRITGYHPDDFINNKTLAFNDIILEKFRDEIWNKWQKVLSEKQAFEHEYQIQRADGIVRWVWERGGGVFNDKDELLFLEGYIEDITERRKAALELEIAKEKAEESDRLKSAFLANMSHEIRTPMNGILGFAELLKETKVDGELQQEYIGIIEKSGMRMLNIINDIIDISKIESGQMKVVKSETNLNEEVEYIYKFFKPEVDEKGVKLFCTMSLPGENALIQTDRDKIYSILTNLVKNAIKFTHSGFIDFGYQIKDEFIEFFVKDTGTGIPAEKIRVIFDRFRQGSELHNRNYEGAGLGLAISKAFTEMLGGKIWVDSTYGKGSAFYFTIPYIKSTKSDKESFEIIVGSKEHNQILNLKILVAEDDIFSDLLITKAVKNLSKNILHAKTGIEAISLLKENPDIDLVLMDIRMPDLDGYETTRQIRTFNQEVIIIAQTAYGLVGDKEKAIEAGCNDYVSKPINQVLLLNTINKYNYKQSTKNL